MNVSSVSRRVPVQTRSEQRLKAILEAAWLVFSEVGFASATLTEIAGASACPRRRSSLTSPASAICAFAYSAIVDDEIIAQVENELPLIAGTRSKFAYLVRTHLYRLTVDGTGLCALILSEGREKRRRPRCGSFATRSSGR